MGTAVNTLFAYTGSDLGDGTTAYPPDFDVTKALKIAEVIKMGGHEKESRTAQQIIKKLRHNKSSRNSSASSELGVTALEAPAEKNKEKRKQYGLLVKDLKRTAKGDEYKRMDFFLDEFFKIRNLDPSKLRSSFQAHLHRKPENTSEYKLQTIVKFQDFRNLFLSV